MAYPLFLAKLLIHTGIAKFFPFFKELGEGNSSHLRYYSDSLLTGPDAELREVIALRWGSAPEVIDLASGAPAFDLVPSGSTKLPASLRDVPPAGGLGELQTAVADMLRAERGLGLQAGEVLITAGVTGAFNIVLDGLVNPGDRVVLFEPASPMYRVALSRRRARVRWVWTWMEDGVIHFDPEHLAEALRGARLVVVNSPANPTGGVFAAEALETIAWHAERQDVLIFNDEVFERFHYDGDLPCIGGLPEARQRTLTAGSLSKGHALASARVGWLAAQRSLLRPCLLTSALQSASVPTLSQQLALNALSQESELFRPILASFDSRRHYAFERLRAAGLRPTWPAGGFFFWLPVGQLGLSGQSFADRLLQEKKVRLWPGQHFGPSGTSHVRLSFTVEDGRLQEGLQRLAEFVRDLEPFDQPILLPAAG